MIKLTSKAIKHFDKMLKKEIDSDKTVLGIRLGVRDSGCSGYAYTIDFAIEKNITDYIGEFENINIFIDRKYENFFKNVELDCVKSGISEYLKFNNPNITNECGCGESFQLKEE